MPQPKSNDNLPTHRTLVVVGRPEGGAVDPETGQAAPGGVCFYDRGDEYRAQPGDLIDVPILQVPGLLDDNICMEPDEFQQVVDWVEAVKTADRERVEAEQEGQRQAELEAQRQAEAASIPPPPQPDEVAEDDEDELLQEIPDTSAATDATTTEAY